MAKKEKRDNPFAGIYSILSGLGGSLSNNKKITVHFGYTTFITRCLIVLSLFCAYLIHYFPSKMSCDGKDNIPASEITTKCQASPIYFKFGENAAKYFKTQNRTSLYESTLWTEEGSHPGDMETLYITEYLSYMILFCIAAILSIPQFLWKSAGAKHIVNSLLHMKGEPHGKSIEEKEFFVDQLKDNLDTLCQEKFYMFQYFFLQAVMVAILYTPYIIKQLFFYDIIMSDLFHSVMTQRYELRTDILQNYFPTLVGCVFQGYGYSGTLQLLNTLCTVNSYYTVQVYIMAIYYVSSIAAIICTLDFAFQVLCIMWYSGLKSFFSLDLKVKGFYMYFIYINYPHSINRAILLRENTKKKIKVSQA